MIEPHNYECVYGERCPLKRDDKMENKIRLPGKRGTGRKKERDRRTGAQTNWLFKLVEMFRLNIHSDESFIHTK